MKEKLILVVDDSRDIVSMIAREIKSRNGNYRVINAGNGEMGVEVAQSEQPDIIIMDWDMPVMNGIRATRTLKNLEATHDIPVIIATGQMTSPENLQMALEAGAFDYIKKPIDFIELNARLNATLRVRDQNQAIQELLKNEIELKNRKLSTTSMLIVEKNALLQEFDQELQKLKSNEADGEELLPQIKRLEKRIKNHLETDNSWDTFKIHFDEVHPDFFKSLGKIGSDISHKDLKICAYLRMGMDNKQIAQLLNITPESMRTSLYRLKKKLNLQEEGSIRDHIVKM
ncbi:MAG: response regulator [Cyclobacteriaceae bacterium]